MSSNMSKRLASQRSERQVSFSLFRRVESQLIMIAVLRVWNADTERLHRRIAEMGERIRQLEDALAILQTNSHGGPHPLLREELLAMKYGLESKDKDCEEESPGPKEDEDLADAFGTLMISNDGTARFFGMTGGSEVRANCFYQAINVYLF